jgi:cellulose synthase/poly-beta-1,6-N-acetylglucosamine synthase-like glycosyltransferase
VQQALTGGGMEDLLLGTALQAVCLTVLVLCLAGLIFFACHNMVMLTAFLRFRKPNLEREEEERLAAIAMQTFPKVLVQLPLYNERHVAERILRTAARLDWPRDRLTIQVLDDSDDETAIIIDRAAERLRVEGHVIDVVRRTDRTGYKAGALAYGLARSDAEFVAIFDADFMPASDFLRRAIQPLLKDERVGVVQCRWDHLNPDENLITQVQSIGLDYHFGVEQAAKSWAGLPMHFNGTCGIWRIKTIEDAGGWQADTVTEDVDLSYRAQLAGYRITYRFGVAVPGEIPDTVEAWRTQQYRWAKGSTQAAVKLLPSIWRSRWSFTHKMTASIHLTHYAMNMLMLMGVLVYPITIPMFPDLPHEMQLLGIMALVAALGCALANYFVSQRIVRRRRLGELLRRFPAFLSLGAGLALSNSRAIIDALTTKDAAFIRTPKKGSAQLASYSVAAKSGIPELLVALWAIGGNLQAVTALTPVMLLGVGGFLWVGSLSLSHYLEARSMQRRGRRPAFPYLPGAAPADPPNLARKPAAE